MEATEASCDFVLLLFDQILPYDKLKYLQLNSDVVVLDARAVAAPLALFTSRTHKELESGGDENSFVGAGHFRLEKTSGHRSATVIVYHDLEGGLHFVGFAFRGNRKLFGPNMGSFSFVANDASYGYYYDPDEFSQPLKCESAVQFGDTVLFAYANEYASGSFDGSENIYLAQFKFTEFGLSVEENDCLLGPFGYGVSFAGHYERALFPSDQMKRFQIDDNEIAHLATSFRGVFRSFQVGTIEIRAWLEQFEPGERRSMFYLLANLRFYNNILVREAVQYLYRKLAESECFELMEANGKCVLVARGGPGKSGSSIARIYRQENSLPSSASVNLSSLKEYLDSNTAVKYIVCVEDVIGSGQDMVSLLRELHACCGELLKHMEVKVVIQSVCALEDGLDEIRKYLGDLPFEVLLFSFETREKCFAKPPESWYIDEDWSEIRRIALKYGVRLKPKAPLGYSDSQMLVVFHDNCPNNTLPIIWASSTETEFYWTPLFPREL